MSLSWDEIFFVSGDAEIQKTYTQIGPSRKTSRLEIAALLLCVHDHRYEASPIIDAKRSEDRYRLVALPGIGLKTASWVVRNMRGSNEIAIIDIHILRACRRLGIFRQDADIAKDYHLLEERFLEFAQGIGVAASYLDLIMWEYVRRYPRLSA